jgi:hypothetical protein
LARHTPDPGISKFLRLSDHWVMDLRKKTAHQIPN